MKYIRAFFIGLEDARHNLVRPLDGPIVGAYCRGRRVGQWLLDSPY